MVKLISDDAIVPEDKGSRIPPGKYYPKAVEIFTRYQRIEAMSNCAESFNQKSEGKYLCVRE